MRLPDNRLLACAVLFAPPLSLTALLWSLRWGFFFAALGTLAFWTTVQILWGLYCRGDNDIPYDEPSDPELFL